MRVTQLETLSTYNHSSPVVAAGKKPLILSTIVAFLQAGVLRRKMVLADPHTPDSEGETLLQQSREIEELIESFKRGDDQICENWDFEMTWIVARKCILVSKGDAWMAAKYPT